MSFNDKQRELICWLDEDEELSELFSEVGLHPMDLRETDHEDMVKAFKLIRVFKRIKESK